MYTRRSPRKISSTPGAAKPYRRIKYKEELDSNYSRSFNSPIDYSDDYIEDTAHAEEETAPSVSVENILDKLDKIESHLAKLVMILSERTSTTPTISAPAANSRIQEQLKPKTGSLLAEVQAAVAQTGFFNESPDRGASNSLDNDINTVGALPSSSYDDEIPNIIGLD